MRHREVSIDTMRRRKTSEWGDSVVVIHISFQVRFPRISRKEEIMIRRRRKRYTKKERKGIGCEEERMIVREKSLVVSLVVLVCYNEQFIPIQEFRILKKRENEEKRRKRREKKIEMRRKSEKIQKGRKNIS